MAGNKVGRTPWSAPGPLAGLFPVSEFLLRQKSGTSACRADQGVCPISAEFPFGENKLLKSWNLP